MTIDPDTLVTRFFERTLPKALWTHEAHVLVCHQVVDALGPSAAIDRLRIAIRAYNEVVGIPNTRDSGYHETITRYFVGAVAAMGDRERSLTSEATGKNAPFRHWSKEVLFSPRARADWVEPDLCPLEEPIRRILAQATAHGCRPSAVSNRQELVSIEAEEVPPVGV